MIQRHVWVSGLVQGVGFRASLRQEVSRFADVTGFVRNCGDGRVEAIFVGRESDVLSLVTWCSHGPPKAQVERLEVKEEPVDPNRGSFEIQSDASRG